MLTRFLVVAAAVVLSLDASPNAQRQGMPVTVPASLLLKASEPPLYLIMLLTDASIPAGIELRAADMEAHYGAVQGSSTDHVSLAQLATAFNRAHLEYVASVADNVFVIRPTSVKAVFLDSTAAPSRLKGGNLLLAISPLFVKLNAELARPGLAGSYPGTIGESVDRGEHMDVSVDTSGRSVLGALNTVVTRVSGHSWIVLTTVQSGTATISQFGFVHRSGVTTLRAITP